SPTHALAVVDTKEDAYSEWYVELPLNGLFTAGETFDVQWYQLYDTTGQMRVSFYFRDANQVTSGQTHFFVTDQSPGWTGDLATSPFEKRVEQLQIPEGTVSLLVTLTSGGSVQVTGSFIIDDLSIRAAKSGFEVTAIGKVATGWQIGWQSNAGKSYTVQAAPRLDPALFQPIPSLESVPASNGGSTTAIDPRPNLGPAQFYRVIELP
ncbi:MAG TPA: hypothetical protein VK633_07595, partial [Verrucomicrobiae bacterium]|nr:hypothetical protein [Verrucomicrobiae bacterium]